MSNFQLPTRRNRYMLRIYGNITKFSISFCKKNIVEERGCTLTLMFLTECRYLRLAKNYLVIISFDLCPSSAIHSIIFPPLAVIDLNVGLLFLSPNLLFRKLKIRTRNYAPHPLQNPRHLLAVHRCDRR